MFFKLIQKREMRKIVTALSSEDREMRALGIKLLKVKEVVRLSFSTIFFLYMVTTTVFLTGIIYGIRHYKLGSFQIPLWLIFASWVLYSFVKCIAIFQVRVKYDKHLDKVEDWLN